MITTAISRTAVDWKALIIAFAPQDVQRLVPILLELGCQQPHQLIEYPAAGMVTAIAHQNGCNICFLDIGSDQDQALELAPEIAAAIPVVGLNTPNDADLILRCLRLGVSEFVSDPDIEQIRGILERFARARAPLPQRTAGAIYCVIPGKPGCGASTLAAHLAIQFGAAADGKVLLVDADSMAAGIAFMLKLRAEFHLADVIRDWKRMDEDLWSRLRTQAWGIDLLLAPEEPAAPLALSREMAGEVAAFWRARYDAVVIDTPDVAAASGFAQIANHVLLVTTNELAALHATRRAITYLDGLLQNRDKLRLVVNRYTPATGLKQQDLNTALELKPFAILSNDYTALQAALLDGKPVIPASAFGRSVSALARRLRAGALKADSNTNNHPPRKKNTPWLWFLQGKTKSK